MTTRPGHTRVTFGNAWTGFDGRHYDQGKSYSVPNDLARHLLALGKVRRSDDELEPVAVVANTDSGADAPADK